MQLIIDIGNTRTKVVLFEKGQIVNRYYPKVFNIQWLEDLKLKRPFDAAILSSVNFFFINELIIRLKFSVKHVTKLFDLLVKIRSSSFRLSTKLLTEKVFF